MTTISNDTTTLEIKSSAFVQRIAILQPSQTADAIGDTGTGTIFVKAWAEVRTLNGQELYRSQQFTSEANRVVIMRYVPGIVPSMTVQLGTRSMNILYADDINERHYKLVLFVQEVL